MEREYAYVQGKLFITYGCVFDRERGSGRKVIPLKSRDDPNTRPSCDMKLVELLERASRGYPGQYLMAYYDRKTGERKCGFGDTLAQFVVIELWETFDPEASDQVQIEIGVHVLENAIKDLHDTIAALKRET